MSKTPKTSSFKERQNDKQVNCTQCDEPSVTLIPVKFDSKIQVDALPDSGSVITLVDRKILPADQQAYPWQKETYKAAGSVFTTIGWISARIEVGKIDYIMPQISICENLPVEMIIGKDWQHAVYARSIHEPDGKIYIITPTGTEYFPNVAKSNTPVACCMSNNIENSKQTSISSNNHEKVMKLVEQYSDIFKNDNNDIGEFQDVELEIKLKHNNPINCKSYRQPEREQAFLRKTVEQWLLQGVCRHSNSPYAASMFVVQQPYHSTTPLRPVVDYSKPINPITVTNVQ